ncbi:MAG: cation:proton antiporter [Candidatus Micrarchaeota archaeon]
MLETGFLLLGFTIVAGFFSLMFFERTKIPDVLILMLLGMLIGPVFGLVDTAFFVSIAPFIGALALIIILFDGGLNLSLMKVLGQLAPATLFTLCAFVVTSVFVAVTAHFAFGWDWLWGLLLGFVVGGTSSNIVIPILSKLNASDDAKLLLNLESALTDALCIVAAISLITVLRVGAVDSSAVLNSLLGSFAIAAIVGVVAGFAWLQVLKHPAGKPFSYMLTLAALFVLYGIIEGVKANGAIGILVFGIIIGNAKLITRSMGSKEGEAFDTELRGFQTEVSFFVRTFFFVYLGLIFNLKAVTLPIALSAVVVLAAIIAARFLASTLFIRIQQRFASYKTLFVAVMPRGLAAAVLAGLPAANGVAIPSFPEIVFLIIILTNAATTIGLAFYGNSSTPSSPQPTSKPRIVAKV